MRFKVYIVYFYKLAWKLMYHDVPPLPRLVRGVSNLASRTYLEVLQARDVYSQPRPTPPQQKR
jgi:hypothetical protein